MKQTRLTAIAYIFAFAATVVHASALATVPGSIPAQFSVSNGAANYSIPIEVAPGRSGMQPEVSLSYNSAGGNGILGMGWSLNAVTAISRCPANLAQDGFISGIRFDSKSRYCLNGQRLIPVVGANGGAGTEYRTEIDGYSQIISYGVSVNNPDYFIAKTKAGQVITFGGGDASVDFSQGTAAWSVREVNDSTGDNPVTYDYFIDQNTQYLNEITYVGGKIGIVYEVTQRPDQPKSYILGNPIILTQRIDSIITYVNGEPLKNYDISYENIGFSNLSKINQLKVCDDQSNCLNPIELAWDLSTTKFDATATSKVIDWGYREGRDSVDHNGDGLSDYCRVVGDRNGRSSYVQCTLSTGIGFGDTFTSSVIDWGYGDSRWWVDFDGDGKTDFCRRVGGKSNQRISCTLSTGTGFGATVMSPRLDWGYTEGRSWADFNGDGLSDYCRVVGNRNGSSSHFQCTTSTSDARAKIKSIRDSYGNTTELTYKPLTDLAVYTKGTGAGYPMRDLQHAQYVVSQVEADDGIGGKVSNQYKYESLKAHLRGRGSFGFGKITETYPATKKTLITEFDQSQFPFAGNVKKVTEKYDGQKINETNNTFYDLVEHPPSGNVYRLNVKETKQQSFELGDDLNYVVQVKTSYNNIDELGNVKQLIVETQGVDQQAFTKTTDNTYKAEIDRWPFNRLDSKTVTNKSPYDYTDEVRKVDFVYDSSTGFLTKERILSAQTYLPLTTTTYSYNDYGQKTDVTISADGEQPRTTTTAYNSIGKPDQSCNGLDQCETYTYTSEGWPESTAGPNGISTSWDYDGFGRKTKETRADGTSSTIQRHFASSGQCGDLAEYAYTCQITQTTGSQPFTVQVDALGRQVRKIKQGFAGRLVYSDTQYNTLAQVTRVSRDYYLGEHIYWASSEYDALGRVIRVAEPGPHGSTNEINTDYNGLTIAVRSGPDQRSKSTISNAIGQKVRIEEEEGAYTEYTYRSDGNLLTTRVAGDDNTTITLGYDEFGRKESMIDPDMGNWTYAHNPFGQLVKQTDAKGQTVDIQYDVLGRMINRTELEGTSSWVYGDNSVAQGSIGKLLQESGSGLVKNYSYDNLGRPVNVNTTIDGQGDFTIQRSYDNLSRVKRVTYPGSQNFYIENQYNADGFLTAITGLRSHAESHSYAALAPLVNEAAVLAESYLFKANELRNLGLFYQSQIEFYQSLTGNGAVNTSTLNNLSQHQNQLSGTVSQGQNLSPEFLGHLNNTIEELQTVTSLINTQSQSYDAIAEQIVILAEQTLAAADHSYQIARTQTSSADIYDDFQSQGASDEITYWRAADVDSSGRISAEVYGNGIVNDYAYNQATGQLQSIHSSLLVSDPIRHLEYQYDAYQNVTLRDDLVNDIRETYEYDRLDRLTATHVISNQYGNVADLNTTQRLDYDVLGNITYKSDVGSYTYGGNLFPHAVMQAGGSNYTYDTNGNMVSGNGRTIHWSSFNKPTQISRNGRSATFSYGSSRARYKKVNHQGDTTLYIGGVYERLTKSNGQVEQKHYIQAAGKLVAEHIVSSSNATQTRYLHKDALGSVDLVTDAYGNVVDRRSFDSWGKLRELPWQADASLNDPLYLTQLPYTNKGYTGHENVQEVELIHMNGRMYDATLARFISADPHIQAGSLSQSYNRYSYVMNNPMKYTDPSGYFFKKLKKALKSAHKSIKNFAKKYGRIIVAIALSVVTYGAASSWAGGMMIGTNIGCSGFASGLIAGAVGGAAAGFVAGASLVAMNGGNLRESIKAGIKGAFSGAITGGAAGGFGNAWSWQRVGTSSFASGVASEIQGGSFKDGFRFALAISMLTYANYEMRKEVAKQSELNPDNVGKESAGFFNDGIGLAGERRVINPEYGKVIGVAKYMPCDGLFGGCQGPILSAADGGSSLGPIPYSSGDALDTLTESFAGPHDWLSDQVGMYDAMGNGIHRTGLSSVGYETLSGFLVLVATPFSVGGLIGTSPGAQNALLFHGNAR